MDRAHVLFLVCNVYIYSFGIQIYAAAAADRSAILARWQEALTKSLRK